MVSFKVILGILFAALVASIAVLGIVSYENNSASNQTAELVRHTHVVLEQANKISSSYKDIQLESNAFLISRDSVFIRPYLAAREEILPLIDQLRKLTIDNQVQSRRIDTLEILIKNLISFGNETLSLKENSTPGDFRFRVKTNFDYREQIRVVINQIKAEESRLLVQRQDAHQASIKAFKKAFGLLLYGIVILLAATFFSVRYNFNKRIKAQDEQKKTNELFVKLFYESPMGIVISRIDTGEIMDCNNAYSELLNYGKSELIGKTAIQLGILQSTSQRNEIVRGAKNQGTARDVEVQLTPKERDPIWVSISMQLIEINEERCLMSAILDMTVHKEAELKITETLNSERELNRLKSDFVTLASHEFRTPLTTILSSAFLLDNYSYGENKEKVGKHVARIKASVNLLTSVLDEFLSLTKIEEGKIEPKTEEINLRQTLETLCGNLKTSVKPGQKIIYNHTGNEIVQSDPVLLGNIINNLISNAIKYSGEVSLIQVTSVVNTNVHLSVKDSGIGISKEDQKHLFERFFRASNAGNIQGTGLGLHLMKHYVDILGGSIEVISETGKGSEFKIMFNPQPAA
ncbi:MAG: ATP-binding protein [Cyclobacteriaceae bacterium]